MSAQNNSGSKNIVPIIVMFFLFGMIAFVTNLAAPIGTIWKGFNANTGMLGNLMNFAAYLFMGMPAGKMLAKIGYKKTALWGLVVGFCGVSLQFCSSLLEIGNTALFVYLLGAFVSGFAVCILNTVVNPMLNLLGGGGNKGNQLIQAGGSINSMCGTLTPMLVGMLVGQVTPETSMADVRVLLEIAMGVFFCAFFILLFSRIPEPQDVSKDKSNKPDKYSAWSFRHTVLGVIGIFFYVGIEIGIPATIIFWLSSFSADQLPNATAVGGTVAAMYWLLMLVGRLSSTVISNYVSTRIQLIFVCTLAIMLIILAIMLPQDWFVTIPCFSVEDGFTMVGVPCGALFLVLTGLCTSIMWGGIFNLAVEGIGKYTAQASGIFMMFVVGGGVMPLLQSLLYNPLGYLGSYWLVVAMLVYLLYYGIAGSKNVNTDIPVGDEEIIENAL